MTAPTVPLPLDTVPTQRDTTAPGFTAGRSGQRWLAAAARTWFVTALVGQLVFSAYITVLYGGALVTGDNARWNTVMPRGHVPGDTLGNAALAGHVLLAVLIMLGGALQLVPAVRRRVPTLHRWVGRAYFSAALLTSVFGLYMLWVRGGAGDLAQHIAISLNAVILCSCAVMAWRSARAREFATHRQWALRAYVAAGGVYFFRLGVFLWLLIFQRPVGFDPDTFSGPFLTTLAFSVYVFVPLSVLQLYFSAQKSTGSVRPRATAIGLFALAVLTAAGIVGASMIVWIPNM